MGGGGGGWSCVLGRARGGKRQMTWKWKAVLFPIPPTVSAQKQPNLVSRGMHRNNEKSWGTDSLLHHIRRLLNKWKILHEERSSGFAELSESTLSDHLILGWLSVPGPLIYLSLQQERLYKAGSPLESLFLPFLWPGNSHTSPFCSSPCFDLAPLSVVISLFYTQLHSSSLSFTLTSLTSYYILSMRIIGLHWCFSGEEFTCQCRRSSFNLWDRKIPWRRKWKPTPIFLPGKSHGQRNLVGYSPWGHKNSHIWLSNWTTWELWFFIVFYITSIIIYDLYNTNFIAHTL